MRIRPTILAAILLSGAAYGRAQTPPVSPPVAAPASSAIRLGEVDFGVRVTAVSGDAGRYQRLRDLRDGPVLDRLRIHHDSPTWTMQGTADHVGYRDQRYRASVTRHGSLKAVFEWTQLPLFYNQEALTPYRVESDGVFRLDDGLQAVVQAGAGTVALAPALHRVELQARRDTARARLAYAATPRLDLTASFTSTAREGVQPWGVSFGQTNAVELPVPVDHRTNDLAAVAEWSNGRSLARLAYDASWFSNAVDELVVDNPLRTNDTPTASAAGRMALWPDSTAHTVSATGSVALPGRSQALAYVSIGSWLQDNRLLPHTINSAIAPIPLARATADAEARIVAMTYRFTTRPARAVWINSQVRLYDYDNRTPQFAVHDYVPVDGGIGVSRTGGSEPFGYTRHFADVDVSYAPVRFAAFRVGYGRERDDRTFRYVEHTTEQTLRAAVDTTGTRWGFVRLQYEHAVRVGTGLDEEAFSDIGEQVSLRQFDISDRVRDRVTTIVQVVPAAGWFGISGSVGLAQENRPDAAFGLQDNDVRSFTVGFDASPRDVFTLTATYGFENYSTLQRSRQANPGPQFDDPTRDWSTDLDENVHTLAGSIEVPRLLPRTSARLGYDYVHSHARYVYLLPPVTTLAPPQQLPPVRNEIRRIAADLRHELGRRLALGFGYAHDRYDVNDFALSPGTLNSPIFPAMIHLMNQWRPYGAHTGYVRMIYHW